MQVGTVAEVWRYPVKSMGGERVHHAEVTLAGISGDRRLGVVDVRSGKLLSAKTVPQLLQASAALEGGGVVLRGPGFEVLATETAAGVTLSEWLGREVCVESPSPGVRATFEHQPDPSDPQATVDLETQPGSFFDSRSVLHLLSDASLRACNGLHAAGDWDVRRFRPNVLVRIAGDGFPEDDWVGCRVRVGTVEANVRKATGRCVLTTRPQPGIHADREVLRSLVRQREGNLGIYLDPCSTGVIAEGAVVEVA